MKMSNREIDRIGDQLRLNQDDNAALVKLADFRSFHEKHMIDITSFCQIVTEKIEPTAIVVSRLKKFSTIIDKLGRLNSTNLHQMQDIAGCRIILESESAIYEARNLLLSIVHGYEKIDEKDYIQKPKKSGYKGIHLIFKSNTTRRVVEVQIRNREQHTWATLVETSDLIVGTKLKERNEPVEAAKVFAILSRDLNSLSEKELLSVLKFERNNKFIERLMKVFHNNIENIERVWSNSKPNPRKKSFILVLDDSNSLEIFSYVSSKKAQQIYLDRINKKRNENSAIVYTSKGDLNSILIGYSNYTLVGNDLIIKIIEILYKVLRIQIENRKYFRFLKYYRQVVKLNALEIDWLIDSLNTVYPLITRMNSGLNWIAFNHRRMARSIFLESELKDYCQNKGEIWLNLFYWFSSIWISINKIEIEMKIENLQNRIELFEKGKLMSNNLSE